MIFARNNKIKRGNVLVEINSDKILNVYVDLDKETAEIEMPIPKNIEKIYVDEMGEFPIVIIEGINHIIAEAVSYTHLDVYKRQTGICSTTF